MSFICIYYFLYLYAAASNYGLRANNKKKKTNTFLLKSAKMEIFKCGTK